ncbi:MAG TPA: hypothetical protein VNR00_06395, partial [Opitutus sp.]|nr:hypothetical protein [Opitutus sp.]
PHWKTRVWWDDRLIGTGDSLSTAHRFEIGTGLAPGPHRLTIEVDNTLDPDIGENSHSVSDHTQGNWNGIVGRMELVATATAWVAELNLYPNLDDRTVVVRGRIAAVSGTKLPSQIALAGDPAKPSQEVAVATDGTFSATLAFPAGAPVWDEFTPALHRVVATLPNGEQHTATFGFRTISHDGRQLTLNGRKLFLRGTLDCAAYPRTGHPPMDLAEWKHVFGIIRSYGLNHVRFHSWCPPEAAFVAADELGLYLQIEVASWPNWSTTLGDGKPVDAWIDAETQRILQAYGNHPSFLFLCAGNEPSGDHHAAWLSGWVSRQKSGDSRRLYTAGAGWPEVPENDFHIRSEPRIHQWGDGLASRINRLPPETTTDYRDFIRGRAVPVVSHEIGQWCAYPNFGEMPKYTGYLKPRNFEIFRESLARHHLADQAHDFLIASGKLQALCYKEDIESALRTPEMAGFQLLGLSDFPGQGTALVGVLDAFWDDKGYIDAATFRRFCASTVVLARLERRVFTTADTFAAGVEVAHFGANALPGAVVAWRLVGDDHNVVAEGRFAPQDIPVGAANTIGRIDLPLARVPAPARYRLIAAVEHTDFENDWDVWVYPETKDNPAAPAGVTVVRALSAEARQRLDAGEAVVLMIPPAQVAPDSEKGRIALGFSSIFWNTAWTNGQAPHTLGILCDPRQPALADFPTEAHSNWQWWYPLQHAAPMILDGLPAELRPIVRVVDDWFTNRKLALAFEARVGRGRLLVTSIDLASGDLDPVRRQLRASLLRYAASPTFSPGTSLAPEQIAALFGSTDAR